MKEKKRKKQKSKSNKKKQKDWVDKWLEFFEYYKNH